MMYQKMWFALSVPCIWTHFDKESRGYLLVSGSKIKADILHYKFKNLLSFRSMEA